jgi:hypothetical protein
MAQKFTATITRTPAKGLPTVETLGKFDCLSDAQGYVEAFLELTFIPYTAIVRKNKIAGCTATIEFKSTVKRGDKLAFEINKVDITIR